MISFTTPLFLTLLPLAAGPFVLHLLNLRKMKKTEFSSLFFLRKLRERRFRWLKLRDILLLILRTLFITSLVLALAGPVYGGRFPLGKFTGETVLIIDDSYSTAARFGEIKAAASRVIDETVGGKKVAVLASSGQVWDSSFIDPGTSREILDALEPSGNARGLNTCWNAANALLETGTSAAKRIVVVSDGQRRALDFMLARNIPEGVEVLFFLDSKEIPADAAILSAELFPRLPLEGEERKLYIRLWNNEDSRPRLLSVVVDGKTISERRVSIPVNGQKLEFSLPVGASRVNVKLDADSIPVNDERFVLAGDRNGRNIALVGQPDSDLLELALRVGGARVSRVSPGGLAGISSEVYDLVIWDGAVSLPSQAVGVADQGVPVLILLGEDVVDVPGEFEIVERSSLEGFDVLAPSGVLTGLESADLSQIHFTSFARLKPTGSKPLLSLSGGDPFMLADTSRGIFFLASRITPRHTDLVYRAIFPALLQHITGLVMGESSRAQRFVGDTLRLRLDSGEPLLVETPRLFYEVTPERSGDGFAVEFGSTHQAGFYRIGSRPFVINPDSAESSAEKIDFSSLTDRGAEVYPLGGAIPRKLWIVPVLLAALCIGVDLILVILHAARAARASTSS